MRKFRLFSIFAMILLVGGQADAIIFGVRYSNLNEPLLPAVDRQDGRGRFGVYFGESQRKHDFLFGIDYDSYKIERGDSLLYARRLTGDIGYRYTIFSLDKMDAMKIMPFVAIHYYRSFAKVKADVTVLPEQDRAYYKDIANDQGGWFSVGAEYYFAPAFSMGCEAGLRYSRAKSKAYGYEIKISEYKTFVAILLSFHL
jgi:hypothetical protein